MMLSSKLDIIFFFPRLAEKTRKFPITVSFLFRDSAANTCGKDAQILNLNTTPLIAFNWDKMYVGYNPSDNKCAASLLWFDISSIGTNSLLHEAKLYYKLAASSTTDSQCIAVAKVGKPLLEETSPEIINQSIPFKNYNYNDYTIVDDRIETFYYWDVKGIVEEWINEISPNYCTTCTT